MELPKASGESIERRNEEENDRRMEISRKAVQTMRYRRDDYNIDELSNGRYGCMLKDLIRTRGMQHIKAQGEEVRELEKWDKRNFECVEKEEVRYIICKEPKRHQGHAMPEKVGRKISR